MKFDNDTSRLNMEWLKGQIPCKYYLLNYTLSTFNHINLLPY